MLKGNYIVNKMSQSTQTEELNTNEFSTQTDDINGNECLKDAVESSSESNNPFEKKHFIFAPDVHERAQAYLDSIQEKYPDIVEKLYGKGKKLMDTFRKTYNIIKGVKKALNHYLTMKKSDKDYFLLVCYLEVFYTEDFTLDKTFPKKKLEKYFRIALSYAFNLVDDNAKKILKEIYGNDSN
jgi:hypothetical protein